MNIRFKAKITYTTDAGHPDTSEQIRMEYEATYIMDMSYFNGYDDIFDYIKDDLRLVAGGGYNSDHIHNVEFDIREV